MPPKPRSHLPADPDLGHSAARKTMCGMGGEWPRIVAWSLWRGIKPGHRCAICSHHYRIALNIQ